MLRHHCGRHASQNVARTTCRHTRIAGHIDPRFAVRPHDQSSVPFEDDNQRMPSGELARHSEPVFLNFSRRTPYQPRHLSRVRSDHQRPFFAI